MREERLEKEQIRPHNVDVNDDVGWNPICVPRR